MDKNEEMNFMLLFQDILNRIINLKHVPEESVEEAIEEAKECFKIFEFPDVSEWDSLCAYLYRYASHGAGLTRRKAIEAIQNCDCLASSLNRTQLKIISLGGGPGNDAIGFCSALFDCGFCNAHLDITVIDKHDTWSECVTLAETLLREGNFGNVTELFKENACMSFRQVDLAYDSTDNDYYELLQNADIILMVKLISIVDFNIVESLFQDINENMKKEAIIIYIDTKNALRDPIWQSYFNVLYISAEDTIYSSTARAPPRFFSHDIVESRARIAVLSKK